jgi:hypothetical protein
MSRPLLIKKLHQRRMKGATRLDGYVEFIARTEETKADPASAFQTLLERTPVSLADFEAVARRIEREE